MDFIWHLLVAAGLFVVIDSFWIAIVANKFYKQAIGKALADKPRFGPAALFYVIYMIAVIVFVVNPALAGQTLGWTIWHGALFGLALYATYDLTNRATLQHWPVTLVIVDMAWGTFLTTSVSSLTYLIFR